MPIYKQPVRLYQRAFTQTHLFPSGKEDTVKPLAQSLPIVDLLNKTDIRILHAFSMLNYYHLFHLQLVRLSE
jgi:hypothetical protein